MEEQNLWFTADARILGHRYRINDCGPSRRKNLWLPLHQNGVNK
jgi:hypothetical protein